MGKKMGEVKRREGTEFLCVVNGSKITSIKKYKDVLVAIRENNSPVRLNSDGTIEVITLEEFFKK